MKGYENYEKKLSSLLLAFCFMISICPLQAMASESIDRQLINRGYPIELIKIMEDEQKQT